MAPPTLSQTQLEAVTNFLSHHGIKGMKWGIRRSKAQLSRGRGGEDSDESPDAVRAKETASKIKAKGSLTAVSDADLNHLVNRINLEKRYADINPSSFQKGHKQVKTLLDVGTTMNQAIKFINSPAGSLLSAQLGLSKPGKHAKPATFSGKKKKK